MNTEDLEHYYDFSKIEASINEGKPFEYAGDFNYDLAPVKLNNHWGYIDTNFDFVIPCKYDSCCIAGKTLCKVYNSLDPIIVSYINRNGEIVWQNIVTPSQQKNKKTKPIEQWGKWNN